MENQELSIGSLLHFAWNTWKSKMGFFIVFFLAFFLIPIFMHCFAHYVMHLGYKGLSVFLIIAQWFVSIVFIMGAIKVCLKCVDNEEPSFNDLYQSTPLFLKYFFGHVLYGLVVTIGFLLLVIPGIYWGMKYFLIPYYIIDKRVGPLEAFVLSGKATIGAKWNLFGLVLVLVFINLLGALALGVGLLITTPLTLLCYTAAYRKLESRMVEG